MRKRIVCFLLVLALACTMVPAVSAADHNMTDIIGHWAEKDIAWVLKLGLFNGTSATTFEPDGAMTRGMFVTVLGRYAGIDPDDYEDWYLPQLYSDVDAEQYYAPYVNWATRHGITSGTGNGKFSPNAPINREQMATFLLRFAGCYGYTFESIREDVPDSFTDAEIISDYALEAVEIMRRCGVITGKPGADGSFRFDPFALAVRSECAAVFHRLTNSLVIDEEFHFAEPEKIVVTGWADLELMPGDTAQLGYELLPAGSDNGPILWISSDPDVVSVDANGRITCNGNGEAEIYAYTCNGCFDYAILQVDAYIGFDGESYDSKCMHVFGEVVEDHRLPYGEDAPKSLYKDNMVWVTVKVWDYSNGIGSEKITKSRSFEIHKNLAATAKLCFQEIYECEAKYPIKSIVSYWTDDRRSEHNPGTALDINPTENAYFDNNGNVLSGSLFDPQNNPYSIPVDGEIQQIFEKYGFTRGIYWRNGYKDYMHFSFFGT